MRVNPVNSGNMTTGSEILGNKVDRNFNNVSKNTLSSYVNTLSRNGLRLKSILKLSPVRIARLYYKALQKVLTDID